MKIWNDRLSACFHEKFVVKKSILFIKFKKQNVVCEHEFSWFTKKSFVPHTLFLGFSALLQNDENLHMSCNQAKWVGTRKYKFKDIAKQSKLFLVFYCFCNHCKCYFSRTNCPIFMGLSPKWSLKNTLVENANKQNTKIFDFRLILLDRITYIYFVKNPNFLLEGGLVLQNSSKRCKIYFTNLFYFQFKHNLSKVKEYLFYFSEKWGK